MSAVPRSMEATSPAATRAVERRRTAFPNAWWGVALLIATEAALLLCLIATYFYLRSKNAHWPPPGIEKPKVLEPVLLTAGLVATSIPIALASGAARRGRVVSTRALLAGAWAIQAAYLGIQIHELLSDIDKVHATATAYGSIYLTMLAAHHLHVVVGLALSAGMLVRLIGGINAYRAVGVRAIALYWHFVNAMAILVVLTQISPRL